MTEEVVVTEGEVAPEATPDLGAKEAELALRENILVAKEAFSKAGIPESMLQFVVNGDATKQKASIDAFSKEWAKAIKEGVESRIKGRAPEVSDSQSSIKPWAEMSYKERVALKHSDASLYETMKNKG